MCNPGAATSEHPFGYPVHVSTDPHSCVHTFHFPTILTCNDTFAAETVSEPDSCIIYHSAIQQYIDISPLVGAQPYVVKVEANHRRIICVIIENNISEPNLNMDDGSVRDPAVRADSEQLPRLHLPRDVR